MAEEGVSAREIEQRLGHSSPDVAEAYIKPSMKIQRVSPKIKYL